MPKSAFTKEEQALMRQNRNAAKPKESKSMYLFALLASVLPLYLYVMIQHMDLQEDAILLAAGSIASFALLAMSYKTKLAKNIGLDPMVAVFYNNALFVLLLLFLSLFLFKAWTPFYNYIGSVSLAAGLTYLVST